MDKIEISHAQDRYENIFNMYSLSGTNGDIYYFYNILNKLTIPSDLDDSVFEYIRLESNMPLTDVSFKVYQSQYLWWLILIVNKIRNPVKTIQSGSILKIIKPEYLNSVFESIKNKI